MLKLIMLLTLSAVTAISGIATDYSGSGMDSDLWGLFHPSVDKILWYQISPGHGGTCWYLRIHPNDSDSILESCDMGGTYLTQNGSTNYISVNDYDGDCFSGIKLVSAVDFCAVAPDTGYAGCESMGMFKTTNHGQAWCRLDTSNLDSLYSTFAPVSAVAVNPDNPDDIWIGLGNGGRITRQLDMDNTKRNPQGIAHSTDGGATWTHISTAFSADALLRKLVIAPDSWGIGNVLFACTDAGIYVSQNDGATWALRVNGLPHNDLTDLDVIKDGTDVIMVASLAMQANIQSNQVVFTGGIWRSTDLGVTWSDATGNLRLPVSLLSNYTTHYQSMTYQIGRKVLVQDYLANSQGMTWANYFNTYISAKVTEVRTLLTANDTILPEFHNVRIKTTDSDVIYASVFDVWYPLGIWKTTNGGTSWINTVRGAQGWLNSAWSTYSPNGQLSNNVQQVWTENQLMNWGTPDLPFGLWDIRTFDLCKNDPDVLYFHSHRVTYRSDNGGTSWYDVANHTVSGDTLAGNGDSNMCFWDLAFSPDPLSSRMMAWMADCGILTSQDDGDSLKIVQELMAGSNQWIYAAAFDPDPANNSRIYLFFDLKDSYSPSGSNLKGNYFMESLDFGSTFLNTSWNNGTLTLPPKITAFDGKISRLLVDPRSPTNNRRFVASHSVVSRNMISHGQSSNELFSTASKGIIISNDGGANWSFSNTGLGSNLNVVDLIADPNDFDKLYAAVYLRFESVGGVVNVIPGGLYISSNSGQSWQKLTALPLTAVSQVVLSSTGIIYVSGGYKNETRFGPGGIFRSNDQGTTWTQILSTPCAPAMTVCPQNPEVIYCAIDGYLDSNVKSPGIWRSEDSGVSWQRCNIGISSLSTGVTAIRFNPNKIGEVWISTYGSGLYRGFDLFDKSKVVLASDFNEGNGTNAADDSVYKNDGTINGAVWTTGIVGNALNFNGSSNYVNFGNSEAFNLTGSRTISAWIKPDVNSSSYNVIASKYLWGYSLCTYDGKLRGHIAGSTSSAQSWSSTAVITTGQWQHVAMTFDVDGDKKIHLYLNGAEISSYGAKTTMVGTPVTNTYNFMVGYGPGASSWFDGTIDDVRLYNKALTAGEIEAIYQSY